MKQILILLTLLSLVTIRLTAQDSQYREYQGKNAQGSYTYNEPVNFPNNLVADDFGPRQKDASTPYDWHGGIDFNAPGGLDNNDYGDIILAIEGGKISKASQINSANFKWITIEGAHKITYEHVFKNGSIDGNGIMAYGCITKHIDSIGFSNTDPNNWAIIFQINGQYNAIGPINGSKVTFLDENGVSQTLTAVNSVAQNAPVASLGNSGTIDSHAHIQGMSALFYVAGDILPSNKKIGDVINPGSADGDKYAKNPLEYITHTSPTYVIELTQKGVANGVTPVYTNNNPTPLHAKVSLNGEADGKRYSNSIVDIEKVEFKIKNSFSYDWVNIQGPKNDKIQFGGLTPSDIKPVKLRTQGAGDWSNTGMLPRMYWNHNYDEFYFADFYVRIHKNDQMNGSKKFALYPWDARYIDGNYNIKVAVTNVNQVDPGTNNWSAAATFPIDNFQPFISGVGVYSGSGTINDRQIYYRDWNSQNVPQGTLHLSAITRSSPEALVNQVVTIYAVASEPLRSLRVKVATISGNWVNGAVLPGSDNKRWQFQYSALNLSEDVCYDLVFEGEDLKGSAAGQGNKLLDLPKPPCGNVPSNLSFAVPYRTGGSTWSATIAHGQDLVHTFRVKACGIRPEAGVPPVVCIISSDVSTSVTYTAPQSATGAINLTINANTSGMSFTWKNAADVVVGQAEDLLNVPAGLYCVEIKQECCSYFDCIEVKNCNLDVTPILMQPAPAMANGSILLSMSNGTEPYQIQWNNGATSNPLGGLAPGNYQVTVEDAFHCTVAKSVTLLSCPVIQVTANVILKTPSACDASDGEIKVLAVSSAGGVSPYTYHWKDENGNILPAAPAGVGPGHYCLVATDANGCTGSQCFDLHPDHFPEILTTIKPSCITANGLLSISALDPESGNYDFVWEDGSADYNTITSERTNLAAGTYCISITSNVTGCEIERCYEVPAITPGSPLQLATTFVNPCPDTKNGSIELTVTGGTSPYSIYWTGNTPAPYNEDQPGLAAGDYTVAVTEYCGTSVVKTVPLKALEIKFLKAIPGCLGQGEVQVVAGQGTPPYSYKWSNGELNSTVSNLRTGNYCVTVTDARGCTVVDCIRLQNKEAYLDIIVNACEKVSQSGSITFRIYNPLGETVTILNEGVSIGPISSEPEVLVTIGQISGDTDYHFDITIGNCVQHHVQSIPASDVSRVFRSYDEDKRRCTYDLYCHGNLIEESGVVESPRLDAPNAIPHSCKVEAFCGVKSVDWFKTDKKTVRGHEYWMVLKNSESSGSFPSGYVLDLEKDYEDKNIQLCEKVRYCPLTLKITSTAFVSNVYYDNGTIIPLGGGCVSLECPLFYKEKICGQLPSGLTFTVDVNCEPRRYNAFQLITWFPELKNTYAGFEFTELGEKIQWLSDIYNGGYPDEYPEYKKVLCAFVSFCLSDFTVLDVTNINTINCDYGNGNNFGCYTNADNDIVICASPSGIAYPVKIDPVFNKAKFLTAPGGVTDRVFIPAGEEDDLLKGFGRIKTDGFFTPKGLIRSVNGKSTMLDYNYRIGFETRDQAPDYLFYEDDWDSEVLVYLEKTSDKQVALNYDTPLASWEHFFSSTDVLTISDLVKSTGQIMVTGTFQGNLNFDAAVLANGATLTGFVAVVGFDGVLIRTQVIQNVATDTRLEIRPGDGKYFVSGTANSSWVKLDGQNQLNLNNGNLFSFQMNDQSPLQASVPGISTSGTVKFVKSVSSKDYTRITYLFKGSGNVTYNQVTYNLPTDGLLLLTLDNAGSFKWMQKILQTVTSNELDLTYDDMSSLYLATTFSGSFTTNNEAFTSNGGKDIFFAKINVDGTYAAAKSYGSPDDEIVKKCFFDSGLLYFGGEYVGQTMERQLGHNKFVRLGYNPNPATTKAYMGYVMTSDLENTTPRSTQNKVEKQPFEAFPNPFNNELIIRKTATVSDQYAIEILDMLGKTIIRQNEKAEVGMNEYRIHALAKLPLGVYMVKITNAHGEEWTQKVVKE